jgi:hypothetical protein
LESQFPGFEAVLVLFHIDTPAGKGDALHLQAQPLFDGDIHAGLDFSSGADYSLPGEGSMGMAEQAGGGAMVERIPGCGGYLTIGGDLSFWD